MTEGEFPPFKRNPEQPWVKELSATGKDEYDKARQHDIEKDVEGITKIFRSLDDFKEVSDEAIGYMALRLATPMRDCYEEGIQVGFDDSRARMQAERARYHSIEIARLGGYG